MKIPKLSQANKYLLLSFICLIAVYLIFGLKKEEIVQKQPNIYADTYIPNGHVLVPLEIANIDSLSALIDQFAMIDLYVGLPSDKGSRKIASRIKLIRAPLNPNLYAVLVNESLSSQIMGSSGPFWAVLQNRNSSTIGAVTQNRPSIQIEYKTKDIQKESGVLNENL